MFTKNALKILRTYTFTSSLFLIIRIYTELIVIIVFDRAENRPRSCGRLLSEVFQRKADYFIVTTSEKTIHLTAALLHRFCDFFKTFESSQIEDSGANK